MKLIRSYLRRLWLNLRETRAVSTVEYALIVVAVIAIIGVAAGVMNEAFDDLFKDLKTEMSNAVSETSNAAD